MLRYLFQLFDGGGGILQLIVGLLILAFQIWLFSLFSFRP
jgi:hypothetical protein